MNEHEEPQLTSRRARRMQEQLETTGIPVVSDSAVQASENPAESAPAPAESIDISPVDENGQPRTRREMRELREAALAARDEASPPETVVGEAAELAPETDAVDIPDLESRVEADVDVAVDSPAEAEAESKGDDFVVADVDTSDFDSRLAQTEALSFADLIEVATDAVPAEANTVEANVVVALPDLAPDSLDEAVDAAEAEAAPAKGRFRLPWSRSKDASSAEPLEESAEVVPEEAELEELKAADTDTDIADEAAENAEISDALDADVASNEIPGEPVAATEDADEPIVEIDGDEDIEPETVLAEVETEAEAEAEAEAEVEVEAEVEPEAVAVVEAVEPAAAAIEDGEDEDEDGEVTDAPAPASARTSYSFPDIAPLAEERSVFDDPSTQAMAALPSDDLVAPLVERTGDFDDLISRAIAAEGATSTNTAALILPSMPEGTGLAGPLGETGELFVTGSIELPKSLGETGGHARLHDSVESDPLADLGIDLSDEPVFDDSAPVSATRAISARMVEGSGVVAPHTKKGNRLPLILSVTAGALLLAVIGLLAWGASNGMFG